MPAASNSRPIGWGSHPRDLPRVFKYLKAPTTAYSSPAAAPVYRSHRKAKLLSKAPRKSSSVRMPWNARLTLPTIRKQENIGKLNYYALKVHRLAQTMCRRLKIVKSRTLSITRISQKLKALCYALKSCNKIA